MEEEEVEEEENEEQEEEEEEGEEEEEEVLEEGDLGADGPELCHPAYAPSTPGLGRHRGHESGGNHE